MGLIACLVLAGCATGYGVDRGGYGQRYPARAYGDLVGTVQRVDRAYNRIVLVVRGRGGYGARGRHIAVGYNQRTRLYYRGRRYPVERLERGDVVRVDARHSRNRLLARSISVVRNVRDYRQGRSYGNGDRRYLVLRGMVLNVDRRAREISLDARYGGRRHVRYDNRTLVEYAGRRYRPANLERGDLIRIQVRRYGNRWRAEHIQVVRDSTRY